LLLVEQGLDALGYKDHLDYDLVESTNPAFQKALVRVNVFRDHRQVGPTLPNDMYLVLPERSVLKMSF
jgi:N-acetyltransferase 10